MANWVGYLEVNSKGECTLSMSQGEGIICVPEKGFIPFGAAGVTVDLSGPGDYPLNLSVPDTGDPTGAFHSTRGNLREKPVA